MRLAPVLEASNTHHGANLLSLPPCSKSELPAKVRGDALATNKEIVGVCVYIYALHFKHRLTKVFALSVTPRENTRITLYTHLLTLAGRVRRRLTNALLREFSGQWLEAKPRQCILGGLIQIDPRSENLAKSGANCMLWAYAEVTPPSQTAREVVERPPSTRVCEGAGEKSTYF